MRYKKTLIISTILGFIIILAYLNFALHVIELSQKLTLILAFAIGPVAIYGVLKLYKELTNLDKTTSLLVGTVFLIIAFALLNLMLVVQQSIFISMKDYIASETDSKTQDSLRLILKGLNHVQLGIDVSFDIFYCLGLILLSLALYKNPEIGKFIGVFGVVSAALLLIFNMATFPLPPANAGLVDLGPLTGVWWLLLIVRIMTKSKSKRK